MQLSKTKIDYKITLGINEVLSGHDAFLAFQARSASAFYLTRNQWESDLQQGILSNEMEHLSLFAYLVLRVLCFL